MAIRLVNHRIWNRNEYVHWDSVSHDWFRLLNFQTHDVYGNVRHDAGRGGLWVAVRIHPGGPPAATRLFNSRNAAMRHVEAWALGFLG